MFDNLFNAFFLYLCLNNQTYYFSNFKTINKTVVWFVCLTNFDVVLVFWKVSWIFELSIMEDKNRRRWHFQLDFYVFLNVNQIKLCWSIWDSFKNQRIFQFQQLTSKPQFSATSKIFLNIFEQFLLQKWSKPDNSLSILRKTRILMVFWLENGYFECFETTSFSQTLGKLKIGKIWLQAGSQDECVRPKTANLASWTLQTFEWAQKNLFKNIN